MTSAGSMRMIKDKFYFMKRALTQAERAGAAGEVPVGAVVVADGAVVARCGNASIGGNDPAAHAEIVALRRAARRLKNYRLSDTEMYVTLEPCLMCYGAMVQARIKKLYFGAADPKGGIFSTGAFDKVADIFNHRIDIEAGLMQESAAKMLKEFFQARRGAGAVERDGLENRYGG